MENLILHSEEQQIPVVIGNRLYTGLSELPAQQLVLLVDENVFRLYPRVFEGYRCIPIASGESNKTLDVAGDLYRQLLEMETDRTAFIVGVGGGLVSDLAGFVASTYMRGVPFGFISTTLLGQVDASIGGKNGVNLDGFKNMVGVIRQPRFVWCDLHFLSTLDADEYLSGVAEVIKYGAIKDHDFFTYLESNYAAVIEKRMDVIEKTIARAAAMKIRIVENDVNEQGERKLLNFGHTMGHAIEKLTGMLHGYAISIGMVLAANLSVRMGYLREDDANKIKKLLQQTGLPVTTSIPPGEIYETLRKDKKRSGDGIHFILLRELGDAFIHPIGLDNLKDLMNDLY
jgi:3-dehydroquinate synthase